MVLPYYNIHVRNSNKRYDCIFDQSHQDQLSSTRLFQVTCCCSWWHFKTARTWIARQSGIFSHLAGQHWASHLCATHFFHRRYPTSDTLTLGKSIGCVGSTTSQLSPQTSQLITSSCSEHVSDRRPELPKNTSSRLNPSHSDAPHQTSSQAVLSWQRAPHRSGPFDIYSDCRDTCKLSAESLPCDVRVPRLWQVALAAVTPRS